MDSSRAETPRLRLLPSASLGRVSRPGRSWPRETAIRPGSGDPRIALAFYAALSAAAAIVASGENLADLEARPRSVDEIVALERVQGWTRVFRALKSQGLLAEQTVGHVVARWTPRQEPGKAFSANYSRTHTHPKGEGAPRNAQRALVNNAL
ncbi:MAG TPA: hypothetical protein VGT40_05080 [Methylomirabilota bacterium]|jgi:hypothetical protein|nr:hypothetical protein [Methylomirabilota bacterium]